MQAPNKVYTLILGAIISLGVVSNANADDTAPFAPTVTNTAKTPAHHPKGMVWIKGGEYSMGSADPTIGNLAGSERLCGGRESMQDARPIHRVYVDGFWMDKTEVTNKQFEKFVKATGYKTIAEIAPNERRISDRPYCQFSGRFNCFYTHYKACSPRQQIEVVAL